MKPWALAGFSGAGKSTVGPLLARAAGRAFVDLDDCIRAESVLERGEPALRDAEADALREIARGPAGIVVALGGGALEGETSRALLRDRFLVAWLDVPLDVARARCAAEESRRRPILEAALKHGSAPSLHARRSEAADEAAIRVDATAPPAELARILLEAFRAAESPP